MSLTAGFALCHSEHPHFCRWGGIRFTGSQGKWIVVRLNDGAVASRMTWGKGGIETFDSPGKALLFIAENRSRTRAKGLNARRFAIVRLLDINYWSGKDSLPGRSPRFRQILSPWLRIGSRPAVEFFGWQEDKEKRRLKGVIERIREEYRGKWRDDLLQDVPAFEFWGRKKKCWFAHTADKAKDQR